ncbi:hypothetical protein ACKFKF_29110 [Phormidesmis sp. 146-12]
MTYRDQLSPWCIIQKLANLQNIAVVRLRRRGEAEDYLKALTRLNPQGDYEIIFDLLDRSQPTLPPPHPQTERRRERVHSNESAF